LHKLSISYISGFDNTINGSFALAFAFSAEVELWTLIVGGSSCKLLVLDIFLSPPRARRKSRVAVPQRRSEGTKDGRVLHQRPMAKGGVKEPLSVVGAVIVQPFVSPRKGRGERGWILSRGLIPLR